MAITRATLESVAAGLSTRLTIARQRLECVCLSLLLIRILFRLDFDSDGAQGGAHG